VTLTFDHLAPILIQQLYGHTEYVGQLLSFILSTYCGRRTISACKLSTDDNRRRLDFRIESEVHREEAHPLTVLWVRPNLASMKK